MSTVLKKALRIVWDITESSAYALGIFVVVYLFLFRTGQVYGSSSYPTWENGEKFITDKISYSFGEPKRGDFVVVESPTNRDQDFLKRIIGLPGETIRLSEGKVYIDGLLLDESSYLEESTNTSGQGFLANEVDYQVPEEYFFVMGDNREHSSDSRSFGPIARGKVVGKVVLRFWPPERFGLVN